MVDKKIQELLEDFRKKSSASAAVLSINFSNDKISNFVSGTVKKRSSTNPIFKEYPL